MNPGLFAYKSCIGKVRHANEASVKRAKERQEGFDMEVELSYYECKICKGWHLTSKGG